MPSTNSQIKLIKNIFLCGLTKPNQTQLDKITPSLTKPNQTKLDQTKRNFTKPNQTQSYQIKLQPNQTKLKYIKPSPRSQPQQTSPRVRFTACATLSLILFQDIEVNKSMFKGPLPDSLPKQSNKDLLLSITSHTLHLKRLFAADLCEL